MIVENKPPTRRPFRLAPLVALAAVLALSAAIPAGASAAGSSLQWKTGQASLPVTKSTGAEWSGKIKVTDPNSPAGSISVECTDTISANVGPHGEGQITGVTTSSCVGSEACAAAGASMTPVGLPWSMELATLEGSRDVRMSSFHEPGFKFVCKVLGLTNEDTCSMPLLGKFSKLEGAVFAFLKSEELDCSQSGRQTGYVTGTQEASSNLLGVEEGTPVWNAAGSPITSEKAVKWSSGTTTLVDQPSGPNGAPWGVTCEESGEGTVSSAGAGTVTKITFSGCKQSANSECNGTDSLEALHLGWKTQLYLGGKEAFSNAIAEGTAGTVAFKIKCEAHGLKGEDTCTAAAGTSGRLASFLTNGIESGVRSKYYEIGSGVSLTCSRGGSENSELKESNHTIKLSNGQTLTVSE
jgi:hypothetical protein